MKYYVLVMKLSCVLVACNDNTQYLDFWPAVKEAWWKVVGVPCVMIYVGDYLPEHLKNDPAVIFFKAIQQWPTATQAQMIRLLYPRELTDEKDGILITDIDMIPLNAKYYQTNINPLPNNLFISYRDILYPDQLAMCYNIASSETWNQLIGPGSVESLLLKFYNNTYTGQPGHNGWYSDQEVLIKAYKTYNGAKIILQDKYTEFKRLDREDKVFEDKQQLKVSIETNLYSDYHCLRPYNKHEQINDFILNCVIPVNSSLSNFRST